MKEILRDALDAEPLLKYSFILLLVGVLIAYHLIVISLKIIRDILAMLFFILTAGASTSTAETKRLTDCALQKQWERDH